jgi:hypothetical protein
MHRSKAASLDHFVAAPVRPFRRSTVRRKNDTKQHSFIQAFLPRSADMRTTIWRDDVVDLVIWNRRPLAVYFDFVMVADHTALSRATVHEVTAGAFAVVSVQFRVEALMPIVACPLISSLRRCAYTKKHGEPPAEQRDELPAPHSITSSARASSGSGTLRPSALAVPRLMTSSNRVARSTGTSAGLAPLRIRPARMPTRR